MILLVHRIDVSVVHCGSACSPVDLCEIRLHEVVLLILIVALKSPSTSVVGLLRRWRVIAITHFY